MLTCKTISYYFVTFQLELDILRNCCLSFKWEAEKLNQRQPQNLNNYQRNSTQKVQQSTSKVTNVSIYHGVLRQEIRIMQCASQERFDGGVIARKCSIMECYHVAYTSKREAQYTLRLFDKCVVPFGKIALSTSRLHDYQFQSPGITMNVMYNVKSSNFIQAVCFSIILQQLK